MISGTTLFFVSLAALAAAQCQSRNSLAWKNQPTFASGHNGHVTYNGLQSPRGIKFDDKWNLLVVDHGTGVLALTERQNGSCVGWEKTVVLNNGDYNHGIDIDGNKLYLSTDDIVTEYTYNSTSKTVDSSSRNVVQNMTNPRYLPVIRFPAHGTRTLQIQHPYLIVARGSSANIDLGSEDVSSGTAQIRRFLLNGTIPDGGFPWTSGELLGHGLRNSVGLTLSRDQTKLWSVENSADQLDWHGADIHQDNPAEEINVIDLQNVNGGFYGYPSCYTVFKPDLFPGGSFKVGDQFSIENNSFIDDNWCQNNVIKPALALQASQSAHSAPLDIKFFTAPPSDTSYSIDKSWDGNAFISFHGSWNRDPPTGYGVVRVGWKGDGPSASLTDNNGYSFLIQAPDLTKCPGGCIRPVGLQFDNLGRLFVSSDATGEIFVIEGSSAPGYNSGQQKATFSAAMMLVPILSAFFL